jgi:hypothetical protein
MKSIKTFEFTILKKYAEALPELSTEENKALAESIRLQGLQIPITLNKNGVIIDGHHRYQICVDRGIPIKYITKEFDSEDEEFQFVIETNLNRRQLNAYQKIEAYSKLFEHYKKQRDANMLAASCSKKIPYAKGGTAVQYAQSLGMGSRRVSDGLYLIKHGTEQLKARLRNGTLSISMAKNIHDKVEKLQKRGPSIRDSIHLECPECKTVSIRSKFKRIK